MTKTEIIKRLLSNHHTEFDEDCGLVGITRTEGGVIHTTVTGRVHNTRENAEYAQLIFMLNEDEHFERARAILNRLCDVQDKNSQSITYGLWSYYFEEDLSQMTDPDYNWAEFISGPLIYIVKERSEYLGDALLSKVKEALRLAAYCCIKRNVGLDYTNVICMSTFTILTIGEIIEDDAIISRGKKELRKLIEYTRFNGAFSEYNSPCYAKIAVDAISKMIKYFKDDECRKIAEELNVYAWKMIARHYSPAFGELTPPYIRNYSDLDDSGETEAFIYLGTNGRYGKAHDIYSTWFLSDMHCPEECYQYFDREMWMEDIYYKKNNLRERDEDVTIIRDFESPDLTAYSYKTNDYLFGALQKTELWTQRRTSMVIWNKESKRCLKLCGIKNDFDFSSAMAYTALDKNKMLTLLGFSTDHGDKHYILDLFKDGKIKAKKLSFMLKTGGDDSKLCFVKNGDEYILDDGQIKISVRVISWIWNGEPGEVRITDKGIELLCFEGDSEREVDFNMLKSTYGVISMAVNEPAMKAEVTVKGEKVFVESEDKKYSIEGFTVPKMYNTCIREVAVKSMNDGR